MQNEEIAKVLEQVADMLEVRGENFFRVRAYRNAARAVRDHPAPIRELERNALREIPGVGADLAEKIGSLIASGDFPLRRELVAQVPPGLLQLLTLPGFGPKRVKLLFDRLGVRDRATLRDAVESGQLRTLRGFGPKIEERLLQALTQREELGRVLYREAANFAHGLITHLSDCAAVIRAEVAGSFRRKRDSIGDLDVLVSSADPQQVTNHFLAFGEIARILGSGGTRSSVTLNCGLQVDMRVIPPANWGAALVYLTGSKAHFVHLRRIAQLRGLMLNEYGLFRDGSAVAGEDEEGVYSALALPWIPPELREDRGEIEAAAEGRLPRLIERSDLRGDLHSHSTWTDGRSSIEEMARAAKRAGLEYLAITDHSQRLAMVNGLNPERLHEQRREIEQARGAVAVITLLHGIEVDIMEDGSLDLPDDALAELDWVVASVHSRLNQPEPEMTRRLIRAIRNPLVDVIGHPGGRMINQREGSRFDLASVMRVAHEEGCALELNSQPDRLDLTDTASMAAHQAGVQLAISSDSHHTGGFALLEFGINQARRGWVQAADVVNTRPLETLRGHRRRVGRHS